MLLSVFKGVSAKSGKKGLKNLSYLGLDYRIVLAIWRLRLSWHMLILALVV